MLPKDFRKKCLGRNLYFQKQQFTENLYLNNYWCPFLCEVCQQLHRKYFTGTAMFQNTSRPLVWYFEKLNL